MINGKQQAHLPGTADAEHEGVPGTRTPRATWTLALFSDYPQCNTALVD